MSPNTAFHIVDGEFTFQFAVDAKHAVSNFPGEWSKEPWPAKDAGRVNGRSDGDKDSDMTPILILCGSNKGGVGKTTIARALLDFLKDKGLRPTVFDTEPDPGVLRRFYKNARSVDVGKVRGQMQVFDEVESAGFTFVDIKAGGLSKVLTTMRDAGLLKDVHAGKMRMIVIHVLGSTEASLREIEVASAVLAEGGEHILVKNHATDGQFFEWDKTTYDSFFKPGQLMLDVPHLDGMACDAVDQKATSFSDFITDETNSRMLRGIVRHWLSQVFAQFETAANLTTLKEGI
jgi:hypothetical protein